MSCNIEKTLIHPIDKAAYKDIIHEDFVSREEFINQTGIFVSPEYFEYIYDMEFKKSGVSAEEFVQNYEEKFSTCVQEIPLHGTFKYEVMDEDVNCVGEYDECYEPNIWEIVNTLARNSKAQFDKRYDLIEQYNGMIDKVQKIPDEVLVLTKFIRQLCLQNDIINGFLECLANNEVCATEIVENDVLKDIWDISMNQLKMILQDVSKNTELLSQLMQVEKEKEQ